MRIIKFKVKTKNGESVKLEEISSLSFGIMVDDRFNAETKELFITCKQGHLRFNLEDIRGISFELEHEKIYQIIESRCVGKEEEDGTI